MRITVTKELAGTCIRQLLKQELSLTTKMLKYLKYRNDGILVNGEKKTVRYVLAKGDVLEIMTEDRSSSPALTPVELPLDILYEDDDVVIPSKSAEMPTHPSHDHYTDTVANALAFRYAQMELPFVFRPINRLDRNTSGLLLVARNKIAAGKLTRSMQEGKIRKTYVAILDGEMPLGDGRIDACLHRTKESIIVREVCSPETPDADAALTLYTVLCAENGHTLVKAHPITGRTHQLRVHFASIGHPITGDDLYGTPSQDIPRHALHAYELTWEHPTTGKIMTVRAPLCGDMQALLSRYFPKNEKEITHGFQ